MASMGTLCNFGTDEFRQIARALSSVPYTVIWKVAAGDLPGNASVESLGLGANVKVCFGCLQYFTIFFVVIHAPVIYVMHWYLEGGCR